eukprot:g16171.t1
MTWRNGKHNDTLSQFQYFRRLGAKIAIVLVLPFRDLFSTSSRRFGTHVMRARGVGNGFASVLNGAAGGTSAIALVPASHSRTWLLSTCSLFASLLRVSFLLLLLPSSPPPAVFSPSSPCGPELQSFDLTDSAPDRAGIFEQVADVLALNPTHFADAYHKERKEAAGGGWRKNCQYVRPGLALAILAPGLRERLNEQLQGKAHQFKYKGVAGFNEFRERLRGKFQMKNEEDNDPVARYNAILYEAKWADGDGQQSNFSSQKQLAFSTAPPWSHPSRLHEPDVLLGRPVEPRDKRVKSQDIALNPVAGSEYGTILPTSPPFLRPEQRKADPSFSFPVDFVLTWINGTHPELEKNAKISTAKQNQRDPRSFLSRVIKRARDYGSLKYAIRSIERYAPWYNHIYIISKWRLRPNWMKENTPKLTILAEEDLLPPEAPVIFNSNVVDSLFGRIPGISKCFIYMNDDYLIVNPTEKSTWCTQTQLPVVFLSRGKKYVGKDQAKSKSIWHNELAFSNECLNRAFGVAKARLNTVHGPYAMASEAFRFIYDQFAPELDNMYRGAIVRMSDDLQIPFLAAHVAREVLGAPFTLDWAVFYREFKPEQIASIKQSYRSQIEDRGTKSGRYFQTACLNDGLGKGDMLKEELAALVAEITDFYETFFPRTKILNGVQSVVGHFEKDVFEN